MTGRLMIAATTLSLFSATITAQAARRASRSKRAWRRARRYLRGLMTIIGKSGSFQTVWAEWSVRPDQKKLPPAARALARFPPDRPFTAPRNYTMGFSSPAGSAGVLAHRPSGMNEHRGGVGSQSLNCAAQ